MFKHCLVLNNVQSIKKQIEHINMTVLTLSFVFKKDLVYQFETENVYDIMLKVVV